MSTIPIGTDVEPFNSAEDDSPAGFDKRFQSVTIVGYKCPDIARELAERLDAAHIEHLLASELLDRHAFLALLEESRIAVCLPREREGFYLTALEGMPSGCPVVTLDCIGNRGFCRHGENCLIAGREPESLFHATRTALTKGVRERSRIHRGARDTAVEHSLEVARYRFQTILDDIDRLWGTG